MAYNQAFEAYSLNSKVVKLQVAYDNLYKEIELLKATKQKEAQEPKKEPEPLKESHTWNTAITLANDRDTHSLQATYLIKRYLKAALSVIGSHPELKEAFITHFEPH